MEHLNEKILELIFEIQDTFPGDPELLEVIRDLTRVSKFLLSKELKKFEILTKMQNMKKHLKDLELLNK